MEVCRLKVRLEEHRGVSFARVMRPSYASTVLEGRGGMAGEPRRRLQLLSM